MDTREKDIEKLKDYKYGFTTDIENIKAPKGLNKDVIKFISNIKKEPEWMLNFRLKAFERFKQLKEPNWQKPKYPKIDYQDLYYYSAPKSMKDKPKSLDELDPKLLAGKLGEDPLVPKCFPEFNSGVIAFKKSSMTTFEKWLDIYTSEPVKPDQPAFRKAVYLSHLRVATLTPEYNNRTPKKNNCFIWHNREALKEK